MFLLTHIAMWNSKHLCLHSQTFENSFCLPWAPVNTESQNCRTSPSAEKKWLSAQP